MANTYSQIYIHVVFAVKGRENMIKELFREELQMYIAGIIREKNQKLLSIFCMPDHIHILLGIRPETPVSDIVRDIKANSSAFIKKKSGLKFSWQSGFGAFSYSKSQVHNVCDYIEKQPEHHRKTTFKEEYLELLKKFDINYDEKYTFETYE